MSSRGNLRAARGAPVAGAETLSALAEPFASIERTARDCSLEDLPELEGWLGRLHGLISIRYAREPRRAIVTPTSDERLLTVEEAAARLSKTPDWIYHHRRELPFAEKVGGHLRFRESGLNDWIRNGCLLLPANPQKARRPSRRRLLTVNP